MSYKRTEQNWTTAQIVGSNLKYLRLRRDSYVPMKVPAAELKVTHQQIAKYESGQNLIDCHNLKLLANFYKVTTDNLLDPTFIEQQQQKMYEAQNGGH
tara:strand:- start:1443 stop:1736 length:294 start_codon:yes stop_codon:yes gene_type:complete